MRFSAAWSFVSAPYSLVVGDVEQAARAASCDRRARSARSSRRSIIWSRKRPGPRGAVPRRRIARRLRLASQRLADRLEVLVRLIDGVVAAEEGVRVVVPLGCAASRSTVVRSKRCARSRIVSWPVSISSPPDRRGRKCPTSHATEPRARPPVHCGRACVGDAGHGRGGSERLIAIGAEVPGASRCARCVETRCFDRGLCALRRSLTSRVKRCDPRSRRPARPRPPMPRATRGFRRSALSLSGRRDRDGDRDALGCRRRLCRPPPPRARQGAALDVVRRC